MSLTTRVGLLAGATALSLTGVGVASTATDATTEEMRAQIQALTQRVQELESNKGENWLTEQRAQEVRTLVQDVLADADTRASLLGSGMTAGYDDGFRIGSADGNFSLRINGQLQSRWIYNFQDDGGSVDGDRHRSGHEIARAKLWFSGHVVSPEWQYMIETGFIPSDRNFHGQHDPGQDARFRLHDAYITRDCGNGLAITVGQFKAPLMQEELVDARYQQSVERSLFNSFFTVGRTQGIMLTYEADMFRLRGSVNEGQHQQNTPWSEGPSGPGTGSTEYSFTARADILFAGNWAQFEELRSPPGEEMGIMGGIAVHVQEDEYGTAAFVNETTLATLTADVTAKFGGANLFGAFAYRNVDPNVGATSDQWGFLVQGGYHFTPEWEGFLRYEWATADMGVPELSVLSGGINYYFAGHQAKFTADLGYAFRPLSGLAPSANFANDRAGFQNDVVDDDGQFVIRTQLQLLF